MRKFILTLVLLVPFLAGCASVNTNLTINNDKSASVEVSLKSDKQITGKEINAAKSNYKKFLDKKYSINKDKKINYRAKKSVKNIKKEDLNLSSLGFKTKLKSKKFIDVKQNFFVTSYNIHMVYDFNSQMKRFKIHEKNSKNSVNTTLTPEYFQKYADKGLMLDDNYSPRNDFIENFEPNVISENEAKTEDEKADTSKKYIPFNPKNLTNVFSITLPAPASYNNAVKSDNNVYYWNLKSKTPVDIQLQYVVYSGFAITLVLLAGALLLIYIARRIWRHEVLKRIGNGNQ